MALISDQVFVKTYLSSFLTLCFNKLRIQKSSLWAKVIMEAADKILLYLKAGHATYYICNFQESIEF